MLCSSGSNAQGEWRALEGRRVSSRNPSRVRDGDKGVAGRNGREYVVFPRWGVIDLPSRQINYFFAKAKQKKIYLVPIPAAAATLRPLQVESHARVVNGVLRYHIRYSVEFI